MTELPVPIRMMLVIILFLIVIALVIFAFLGKELATNNEDAIMIEIRKIMER